MHTISDHEAEVISGGFSLSLPAIQVSPQIIVNTVPQINAGSSIALLGGMSNLDQGNNTDLWNGLIAGLFSF
jgi:hypothetical protein